LETCLTNGVEYEVSIVAGNVFGNSVFSNTVFATPQNAVISDICFTHDTMIQTDQGDIEICRLEPGVHTISNHDIQVITKTISKEPFLVVFEKNSLALGCPNRKTIVSQNHRIFNLVNKPKRSLARTDFVGKFYRAVEFVNFKTIRKIPYRGETLFNVLLDNCGFMIANNLLVETLDPLNQTAQLFFNSK
jgi:hypothetical protein